MIRGARPPRALYVHYPFCAHHCHYCDFSVTRAPNPPVREWLDALSLELEWWFQVADWVRPVTLDSIFVGGGTPSLIDVDAPRLLSEVLADWFDISNDVEWTIESNPASLSPDVAAAWRAAGANRISIGVQAFDDGVLEWLGRLHDRAGAERSIRTAREAGFDNVSVDLLFGLPQTIRRDLDREVQTALSSGIDHASVYGLTVEPSTPLARRVELGDVTPTSGTAYAREYRRLASLLSGEAMTHYEVSSFARVGRESRHNWYYWNRAPYLGLGPSAHGFFPPFRIWNEFRWDRYRAVVRTGAGPVEGWEELDRPAESLERLWLGLRTREGLAAGDDRWETALAERLPEWEAEGWVRVDGGRVRATVEGWLRLDELVAEIGRDAGPSRRARR